MKWKHISILKGNEEEYKINLSHRGWMCAHTARPFSVRFDSVTHSQPVKLISAGLLIAQVSFSALEACSSSFLSPTFSIFQSSTQELLFALFLKPFF